MKFSEEDVQKAYAIMGRLIEKYNMTDHDANMYSLSVAIRIIHDLESRKGSFYDLYKNETSMAHLWARLN